MREVHGAKEHFLFEIDPLDVRVIARRFLPGDWPPERFLSHCRESARLARERQALERRAAHVC